MKTIAHWTKNKNCEWTAEFRDEAGAPVTVGDSTEMPIYQSNDLDPNLPIAERKLNALGLTFGHRDDDDIEVNEMPAMPALDGSEKQVAWALDIRSNAMQTLKKACKPEVLPEVTKAVESIDSAAWWIDNRYDTLRAVLKVAVANRKEHLA